MRGNIGYDQDKQDHKIQASLNIGMSIQSKCKKTDIVTWCSAMLIRLNDEAANLVWDSNRDET